MEIKEERSSDEARQFLPSSQLDSLGEPQFTSKCMYSFYGGYYKGGPVPVAVQIMSQAGYKMLFNFLLDEVQFRGNKQMKIVFNFFSLIYFGLCP